MNIKIIKNENQYREYLKRMREIFNTTEGTAEPEELEILALVLDKYEEEHYPIPESDPTLVRASRSYPQAFPQQS
jgi:HTH-type transcriptional regulator/antitoxin HigA